MFGTNFNQPNGITFFPTGVMLVAEVAEVVPDDPTTEIVELSMSTGNVLVIGGWRNEFKRGDANGDGKVDISDSQAIWDWVFQQTAPPKCFDGADADDDSIVNDSDGNYIMDFLFCGGPPPKEPGPFECGKDPTRDLLDCTSSDPACEIQ